jgi:hypothetical protein
MKQVAGLSDTHEPVQCLEPDVRVVGVVMDAKWGRMADQNIECAPVADSVPDQLWQHPDRS